MDKDIYMKSSTLLLSLTVTSITGCLNSLGELQLKWLHFCMLT